MNAADQVVVTGSVATGKETMKNGKMMTGWVNVAVTGMAVTGIAGEFREPAGIHVTGSV